MPYASVLCYPKVSEPELQMRLEELQKHGITTIEFSGKGNAFNIPVLGKGYVGVVVVGQKNGERLAVKIRRVDADRPSLEHEAQMLAKANSVGIGPKLIGASKNFLLMQLIDGDLLPFWLESHKEKAMVCRVLREVLFQCWQLDLAGVDHGELSKAPKHVIVDFALRSWIVDFETASDTRKPANVTAICQFLFNGGGAVARVIAEVLGERDVQEGINALRLYKKSRTCESFEQVLRAYNL